MHLVAAGRLVGMPQLPAEGWLPGSPGPELREPSGPAASWRRSGLCWPAPQAFSRTHTNPASWGLLCPAALHIPDVSCVVKASHYVENLRIHSKELDDCHGICHEKQGLMEEAVSFSSGEAVPAASFHARL